MAECSRAAESSVPCGAEAGRGHSEVDGRGGAEGTGSRGHVEENGQMWRALLDWEPVETLQDGGDGTRGSL